MFIVGLCFFVFGLIMTVFKGYVVWDAAHDAYGGGGVPTLDFPIFCPIPLACGINYMLKGHDCLPFDGFGFVIYLLLAVFLGFLLWHFYRLGKPERERQRQAIERETTPPQNKPS